MQSPVAFQVPTPKVVAIPVRPSGKSEGESERGALAGSPLFLCGSSRAYEAVRSLRFAARSWRPGLSRTALRAGRGGSGRCRGAAPDGLWPSKAPWHRESLTVCPDRLIRSGFLSHYRPETGKRRLPLLGGADPRRGAGLESGSALVYYAAGDPAPSGTKEIDDAEQALSEPRDPATPRKARQIASHRRRRFLRPELLSRHLRRLRSAAPLPGNDGEVGPARPRCPI
jgi:hypothetical protein